jgi:hypothetical protein
LEPLHGDLGHGRHDRSAASTFFFPFLLFVVCVLDCGLVVRLYSALRVELRRKGAGARVIYSRRSR